MVALLQGISGNLFLLASGESTPYSLLNYSIAFLAYIRESVGPVALPFLIASAFACLFCPLTPRWRRLLVDIMFALVGLRLLTLFGILNLMIFFPPSDRILLFSQLLIFLPCLLLVWGWLYWRFDSYSVAVGRGRIFSSSTSGDKIPSPVDYFIASFTSLLTNTLDNFDGTTRVARVLIYIHGIMTWDIMALALSRAIALASA
ncbi:MAG: hypothetical protein KXJ50_02215 [Vulcanococcus sp.]|uniref:hypothetical protein n=1 Tax=Vulcanococcus sp. TaxID=2856995 RepID=UPI0025FB2A46|nr:hypothetical protein [Vulcanococcus sp.]MBW0179869.1 hypothetical protein [Vulcanococcus sp.]